MNNSFNLIAPLAVSFAFFFSHNVIAAPIYTNVGTATNSTAPSEWLSYNFEITSFLSGTSSATLTFDLRNDAPFPQFIPNSTTSQVQFGVENSRYFVHFSYLSGGDTSHWRNVELLIDGVKYTDQYDAFNNHLGDEFLGTAYQGGGVAYNILGETGFFDVSTYVMTPVPAPSAMFLFGSGLLGILGIGRNLPRINGYCRRMKA